MKFVELSTKKQIGKKPRNIKADKMSESLTCYLMISPQLIGFMFFTVYPILWVLRFTVTDYDGISANFIGIDNFVRVFTRDWQYWQSVLNTFVVSFGKLIVELPLALILALLVTNKIKGNGTLRTIYFLPNVVSSAIMGLVFSFIFGSVGGIVNSILGVMGWINPTQPINFFGDKWLALTVVAIASIWHAFGMNMLYFMAGIHQIPRELYECADIDGANSWEQFKHITIPMLAPLAQVIVMLAIMGSLKISDTVLVLTNGQPAGQSDVVMTYMFKYFFSYGSEAAVGQLGYAAAMGLVTSFIIGGLTLFYLQVTKKANSLQ